MKHYVYETMLPMGDDEVNDFEENCEFVIFAKSRIRSAILLSGFRMIYRQLQDVWHPEMWESWEIAGQEEHLTEALTRGEEGLGVYDPEKGWTIIPWPEKKYGQIMEPHLRIV
ncbi:hypothetical protein [Aquisediminimonas profunda]|uniref:hypothetical protein n=1 Tax=Aquisediminimonas profunda TaxID=1550733 RepID=UPI001C62E875|nr:hypothetical protein [Aquisediminimonas profunda]